MTWSDFYLSCFVVGFTLSSVSFLLGSAHLHMGHGHGGHLHLGKSGLGKGAGSSHGVSWFNFATLTAFLAWFGGAGYLLTRYSGFVMWLGLAVSVLAGLAGGGLVFWFLVKLAARERPLDPADYDLIGALGTVSSNIRPNGTGEMIFVQQGARKGVGARSEDGSAIPKGIEVVITRYEKGIAYVRRWDELAGVSKKEEV